MTTKFLNILLLGLTIAALAAAASPKKHGAQSSKGHNKDDNCFSIHYDGLGALPGKEQALPFAEGLISVPEETQRAIAIRPDGKELFFMSRGTSGPQIMQSLYLDGQWQPPTRASFSNIGFNAEPSISPDGHTLYFVSTRPPSKGTDIWKTERINNEWSEPVHLSDAVNSDAYEFHPQAVANGDVYFAAAGRSDSHGDADLYVSKFQNGTYLPAQNLGTQINTSAAEWDPYVSPSNDYMIFKSNRPGGYGAMDMYISMREGDSWTTPRNLGPVINTADDDDSGDVTPDGRYLIFARSKPGKELWKLYWIDMRAVLQTDVDHCQ